MENSYSTSGRSGCENDAVFGVGRPQSKQFSGETALKVGHGGQHNFGRGNFVNLTHRVAQLQVFKVEWVVPLT